MMDIAAYGGLFLAAFIAATIVPAQSEAVLVGLLLTDSYPPATLILVATVGNVLGSTANWVLGRCVERFRDRAWFPAKPETLQRAQAWYQRYGKWSLLLSWAPIIGDPLTIVAGILREPLGIFLVLVTLAKLGRYLVLAGITLNWM